MKRHLLFVWLAFFSGVYLLGNFLYRAQIGHIPELPLETRVLPAQGLVVTDVSEAARAAGAHPGDRIVSINGRPTRTHQYYFLRTHRFARLGESALLGMESGGKSKKATLFWETPRRRQRQSGVLDTTLTLHRFFFDLLLPAALWVIALTLNFTAAQGPTKIWASLMILSQTLWFPGEPKLLWPMGLRELGYLFNGIFGPLFFVFALVFFTRFPVPLGSERRYPWLKWVLLAALMFLGAFSALHSLSSIYHFGVYTFTSRYTGEVKASIQVLWLLCFLCICASRVRLPEALSSYERSRMALIWAGIFVGFLPPSLLLFLGQAIDSEAGIAVFPSWLQMLAFLFFLAFPISVAVSVIGWRKALYTDSSTRSSRERTS